MEDLKQDLKTHMEQDREDFATINTKLDQLLGQWKLVGVIFGTLSGIIGTIAAALLSN